MGEIRDERTRYEEKERRRGRKKGREEERREKRKRKGRTKDSDVTDSERNR